MLEVECAAYQNLNAVTCTRRRHALPNRSFDMCGEFLTVLPPRDRHYLGRTLICTCISVRFCREHIKTSRKRQHLYLYKFE